jgi:hypothetical protein
MSLGLLDADGPESDAPEPGDAFLPRTLSIEGLTNFLALVAMYTLCDGLHGSTPGKRLLGLTVTSVAGGPASLGRAGASPVGCPVRGGHARRDAHGRYDPVCRDAGTRGARRGAPARTRFKVVRAVLEDTAPATRRPVRVVVD